MKDTDSSKKEKFKNEMLDFMIKKPGKRKSMSRILPTGV
jgi:hypothetical protein